MKPRASANSNSRSTSSTSSKVPATIAFAAFSYARDRDLHRRSDARSSARGKGTQAAGCDPCGLPYHEVFDIIREHQMTSIELLERVGLMSSTLNIGHGNFTADNPLMNYSGSRDLEIMGHHNARFSLSREHRKTWPLSRQLAKLQEGWRQYCIGY